MAIIRGQEHEHVQVALNRAHAEVLDCVTAGEVTARRKVQIAAAVDQLIDEAEREGNSRLLYELRRVLPAYLRRRDLDAMVDPLMARVYRALPPGQAA